MKFRFLVVLLAAVLACTQAGCGPAPDLAKLELDRHIYRLVRLRGRQTV